MINRVLIRMKTVQLLYSYLLVEKSFSLEGSPSAPTKEKRFAYNLYLETVNLMVDLAHKIVGKNKSYPLSTTRFILRSEDNETIKSLQAKYNGSSGPFSPIVDSLKDAIKESYLFKEFEKNREEGKGTENFWENIFKLIILPNHGYNEIVRTLPNYTIAGVERMKSMMQETFSNFYASQDNIDEALRTLERSMQTARDLYMRLLSLPVELTSLRRDQLAINRRKLLANEEDLNPNTRFISNEVPEIIENNPVFADYAESQHLSWRAEDPELLEILLKAILNSELYQKYLSEGSVDIKKDSEFWQDVITDIILQNESFLEYLENKSVFWNDDLEIMASFVIKTLKRIENPETRKDAVLPMYKDGDHGKDAKFGAELFRYVVVNKNIYRRYIQEVLENDKWEAERLAFMDVVIIMAALAEIINYPEIPLNVSINEYIEIAKSYSSAKSGQFIHGLLSALIPKLQEENVIRGKN